MNANFRDLYDIARNNGQSEMAEKYSAVISSMNSNILKRYAVLGESNCGKSTIINAFTGEKSAPVSLLSGKHDKILTIECKNEDYELIEISGDCYLDRNIKAYDNPLWNIDAAVYIISALNPLTATDIQALKACISKGIPCITVLNKFHMVDDDDREFTLKTVKSQLYSAFNTDEIIVFDNKNSAECAETILKSLTSSEDSLDIKEYALTMEFAKELNKYISAEYDKTKEVYETFQKQKGNSALEELYWDELALEIDKFRIRLTNETDTAIYDMYHSCNLIMSKKMNASQDPGLWWKSQLRREMDAESQKISQSIRHIIENHTFKDKEWISNNISSKFGINLKMDEIDTSINTGESTPRNLSQQLSDAGINRKKAVSSLLVSSAVLAGGIVLPLSLIPTIIACSIGGVAVAGTGFWAYVESNSEKEEKNRILQSELDKYVSQCRDATLESIRGYIKYFYENMTISARDAQMVKMAQEITPSDEERIAMKTLTRLASDKKNIDEILSKMMISDDE